MIPPDTHDNGPLLRAVVICLMGHAAPQHQRLNDWEGQVVRYFRHPDKVFAASTACKHCGNPMRDHGWVDTLEGGHTVCPGDWVVTGVAGERYPVKPAIFEATYDPADN